MKTFTSIIFCTLFMFYFHAVSYAEFTKRPYLQNVQQDSITICWKTDVATPGTVYYGLGNTNLYKVDSEAKQFHEVKLTGLNPGSYMYYVEAGSDVSEITNFFTAVAPSTDFRFVAYGDNRTGHMAHTAVVNLAKSMTPRFLVNVGDMYATNDSIDVDDFFTIEQNLINMVPLFPARGNHEYINLTGQPDRFSDYFSLPTNLTSNDADAYYSFNYGNSHFLFINTEIDYSVGGTQYVAIESDLANADADPSIEHIFVVMHRAAHSNGMQHGGAENPDLSKIFGPLFVKHNVDIVFQGHDHHYERFQPEGAAGPLGDPPGEPDAINEGVTYVVTGGGGAPLGSVPTAPHEESGVTPNLTSQAAIAEYEAIQVDISGKKVHVITRSVDEDINGNGILDPGEDINGNGMLDGSRILDEFIIDRNGPPVTHTITNIQNTTAYPGGAIGPFTVVETNNTSFSYSYNVTGYVVKPDGSTIWWPTVSTTIAGGEARMHDHVIEVPVTAETGTYTFGALLTDTNGNEIDRDTFNFTVLSPAANTTTSSISSQSVGAVLESPGTKKGKKGEKYKSKKVEMADGWRYITLRK